MTFCGFYVFDISFFPFINYHYSILHTKHVYPASVQSLLPYIVLPYDHED